MDLVYWHIDEYTIGNECDAYENMGDTDENSGELKDEWQAANWIFIVRCIM